MLRTYFRLQTRTATVFMWVYCLIICSTPTTSAFWRTWKPFSAARVGKSRDLAWVTAVSTKDIHYLASESNSTVNFCAPFKTSVNDMKYRERGNGLDRAGSAALSTWLHIDSAELESVIYRPLLPLYCIVLYGDIVHSVTYRQHINHCIVPSVFSVWIIFPRSDRARVERNTIIEVTNV